MHHDVAPQVEAAPVAASARAAIAVAIGAPVDEGRVTVAIWAGKVVADDDRSDQSNSAPPAIKAADAIDQIARPATDAVEFDAPPRVVR